MYSVKLKPKLRNTNLTPTLTLQIPPKPKANLKPNTNPHPKAVELKDSLQEHLGDKINLPNTLMFNYPTAAAIAEYIENVIHGGGPISSMLVPGLALAVAYSSHLISSHLIWP